MAERITVVLVGLGEAEAEALGRDGGFDVERRDTIEGPLGADAVVLAIGDRGPLEALRTVRRHAPDAAVVVISDPAASAEGTVALHAGAEEHLVRDDTITTLLPRVVRHAVTVRALRAELETVDLVTGLSNLRGFVTIADHHLRIADRSGHAVAFVFVRLEEFAEVRRALGADAADDLARDASDVILEAVRDSDVPARLAPDTLCVLLTGAADGAEAMVLSRLVEAMATHDARGDRPRPLAFAVGSARYAPGTGGGVGPLLEEAARSLAVPER